MSDLRVKYAIATDSVLIDQRGAILAEIVENFHNMISCQYLLQIEAQVVVKWIDSKQVEDVAVLLEAQLEQGDGLALDQAFTVQAKYGRRIAHPDLST